MSLTDSIPWVCHFSYFMGGGGVWFGGFWGGVTWFSGEMEERGEESTATEYKRRTIEN